MISGLTQTEPLDPIEHVTHDGEFEDVAIDVSATRVDGTDARFVRALVETEHGVRYTARENLLIGEGELHATDDTRDFRNRTPVLEVHTDAEPALACVEVHLNGGRFERVGTLARAEISVRVTVERGVQATDDCHDDPAGDERTTVTVCGLAEVSAVPIPPNFDVAQVVGVATLRQSGCSA